VIYQEKVIAQLLEWIEQSLHHNPDQALSLDHIAARSGYSKWHLQRMFKQITGQSLGGYTRRRRLSLAAEELRLTSISVASIADKYQFDSQQTFTRSFKLQFGQPPAAYRKGNYPANLGVQQPVQILS